MVTAAAGREKRNGGGGSAHLLEGGSGEAWRRRVLSWRRELALNTSAAALQLQAKARGALGCARCARRRTRQRTATRPSRIYMSTVLRCPRFSGRRTPRALRQHSLPARRRCCASSAAGAELAQTRRQKFRRAGLRRAAGRCARAQRDPAAVPTARDRRAPAALGRGNARAASLSTCACDVAR